MTISFGRRVSRWTLLASAALMSLLFALACAGGDAPRVGQSPQQPAPAAQPQPAASAPDPQAARAVPGSVAPRGVVRGGTVMEDSGEAKYGGVLRAATRRDPGSFDSMFGSGSQLRNVIGSLFGNGNIIKACPKDVSRVCGSLAESWEPNDDFTQWTFKLRDDVKWHDGTPFTAEDVKFWAELAVFGAKGPDETRAPARWRLSLGQLESVDVLDRYTARLNLARSAPALLDTLRAQENSIAHPKHIMEARIKAGDVRVAPEDIGYIGLGPFKHVEYRRGVRVTQTRFEDYYEKDAQGRQLPYLDGVEYAIISDARAMDAAFRTGRLDTGSRGGGFWLTPDRKRGYERDLGDQVWFAEIMATRQHLTFNTLRENAFQDVRVRRAIQLWMDKRISNDVVLGEGFGFLFGIFPPGGTFSTPTEELLTWPGWSKNTRQADQAEALRLLSEAGYGNGFEFQLLCRRGHLDKCEFTQGHLAEIGITVNLDVVDDATNNVRRLGLDFDAQLAGATYDFTPEALEQTISRHAVSPNASPKHDDYKIDEFYERLANARNLEERGRIGREIEQYVLRDQAYMVPLWGLMAQVAFRTYVKGVFPPAFGGHDNFDWATTWLDK